MVADELPFFAKHIDGAFDAFNARKLSESAIAVWFKQLQGFSTREVFAEVDDCVRRLTRPPTCADLWKALNERRSEHIEAMAAATKASERRDAQNLFAGRTPLGDNALAQLRTLLQPKRGDRKAWAYKILDRIADQDPAVTPAMSEMCRRALEIPADEMALIKDGRMRSADIRRPERQPGEDDA